jgi:hypothetical protein
VFNFGTRDGRTTELLYRLQNGTHRGQGDATGQSTHGRMGLGTACEAETSGVKSVSIENSGGKIFMSLDSEKLCIHRNHSFNNNNNNKLQMGARTT